VLQDADLDSAVFGELEGLLDGERVAWMDVIVGDWEWGLAGGVRWAGFRWGVQKIKIPTQAQNPAEWGTRGEMARSG